MSVDLLNTQDASIRRKPEKYNLLLFLFYLIAHGGILFIPNAIYWDDWILYRAESSVILDLFRQTGSMFNYGAYLHIGLLELGPWIYKWLTFVLMFASGLLLNSVVKRHQKISDSNRFFLVLLFLVLPFNLARVALIDFPYTLCYFLFFLAWALMDRFRLLALALFFLSFNTNSLLVFYALPFFDILYRRGYFTSWKNVVIFIFRFADYFLLPFIYFLLKTRYFTPSGLYEGYNEGFNALNLIVVPSLQFVGAFKLNANVGLITILAAVSFYLMRERVSFALLGKRVSVTYFIAGLIVFILGAFPYWIVGLVPNFTDWNSRHQLLLPLGCALVVLSVWHYLKGGMALFSVIVGVCLAINVATYKDFYIDWQKQQQLIKLFSSNADVKDSELVVIDDQTIDINAMGRVYRFYEWNGLFEVAFANQKRFGISKNDLPRYFAGEYRGGFYGDRYKSGSFKYNSTVRRVDLRIRSIQPVKTKDILVSDLFPIFDIVIEKSGLDYDR
jgi:hypothetical protein